MARPTKRSKNPISEVLVQLRQALGENQQQFANRTKTAITTIARYETSRPPKGKALAQFARLANEARRPDLAARFDQALAADLGEVSRSPEAMVWADAITQIRQVAPEKFEGVIKQIATVLEGLKDRISDPIEFNRAERLLVLLRRMVENKTEKALLAEAKAISKREGISESKALQQLLRAHPERYVQADSERENMLRDTQHSIRKTSKRRGQK